MKLAPFYSIQPLRDIMRGYNDLCTKGFDPETTISTLECLNKAIDGNGYMNRPMHDYTRAQFE